MELDVELPPGVSADVRLPFHTGEVGSGRHSFAGSWR
jgi:hypothetical protein